MAVEKGRLTIDGYDRAGWLRQATAEATAVRGRLCSEGIDVSWVTAVIVAVGAGVAGSRVEVGNVKVVSADRLCNLIVDRRVILSDSQRERCVAVLSSGSRLIHK